MLSIPRSVAKSNIKCCFIGLLFRFYCPYTFCGACNASVRSPVVSRLARHFKSRHVMLPAKCRTFAFGFIWMVGIDLLATATLLSISDLRGFYAGRESLRARTLSFYEVSESESASIPVFSDTEAAIKWFADAGRAELMDAHVLNRDMWLLAVGEPAQGAAFGAAGGAAASSELAELRLAVQDLRQEIRLEHRRTAMGKLFIRPIAIPPASSASSHSPRPEDVPAVKDATIDYYNLWASFEPEKHKRRVYTMVPDASGLPQSVPYQDAILSRIWPSSQAREARAIGAALGLPRGFHVSERNFLVLPKIVERMFDADALLLFPSRGTPPSAKFRSGRVEAVPPAERAAVPDYVGRALYLPQHADGKVRVPSMRLLGWKAVSALRAEAEAAAAARGLPPELELDSFSSLDAEGVAAVRKHGHSPVARRAVARMQRRGQQPCGPKGRCPHATQRPTAPWPEGPSPACNADANSHVVRRAGARSPQPSGPKGRFPQPS